MGKTAQRGFTLIELVVVIVILGILAATALPKFIDFSSDAKTAGVAGVAGGIASATSINYAGKLAGKNVTPGVLSGTAAAVCTQANMTQLLTSGWPNGYDVAAAPGAANCATAGTTTCAVYYGAAATSTYSSAAGITCY